MPPNSSDTFVILKPQAEWPDPGLTKADLQERIEAAVGELAGNVYEFSQPIQLRFNELLAGTRGDLAVKVFGDEFEPMLKAANQDRRDPARDRGRRRREGRADGRPAVPRDQDRQDRGGPPRPEHRGDPGGHRRGHRRPGGRYGVRGRPALPDRRAPERQGPRGPRGPGEHPGAPAPGAERPGRLRAPAAGGAVLGERGAEPDQPRERPAARRRHRQRARPRHRLAGGGGAGQGRRSGAAAGGLLRDLGRPVREPGLGPPAPDAWWCRSASS